MKILCVEDDEGLVALLQQVLVKQHYQVEFATDGLTGWHLAEADTYDLILLDWVLPNLSGLEFCQKLRTQGASVLNPNWNTPVLLMTTMDAVTNKVMGLNAGADDYVVKPLVLEELLARIQALLRRNQAIRTPLLQWGDLCLNPNRCEVTYQGQAIALASKEYELLELFLRNPEQIFNLNRLLTALWTAEEIPGEGAVRAHIKGLRHKLKHAGADDPLETIYKLGYRLRPPGEPKAAGATKETVNPPVCEPQAAISSCQIPLEFWEIWETVRSSYCDRLLTIQQAVAHLQTQSLTPEEQQRTAQEAHTLVGSLGSFGLEEASELARQIQQILQQATPLTSRQGELLTPLIAALAQQLGQSEQPEHLESSFQELSGAPSRESSGELAKGAIALLENILHQYTVLLIDDCAEDRLLYSRYLRRSPHVDYTILEAETAEEGLEIYQSVLPDLILLDYLLPDMNGLEFLQEVAQDNGKPAIPIVILTGHGNEAIAIQAIKSGAQDYLVKNHLTAELLCKTITHAIEQFQLEQELTQRQQQQQIITEMALRIRQSLDLHNILQTTVNEVQQFLQCDRVIILRFTSNWGGIVVVEATAVKLFEIFQFCIYDPCIGEEYIEPFKQGLVTARADILTADISPCHRDFLLQLQVRANLVVPILKNNELWGLLTAHHCTAPREWQAREIDLLRQIAAQVGIALQHNALLQRVQAELKDRQQAEAALKERESVLGLFAQYAPAGIAMFDQKMRYVMASQRWVDEYNLGTVASILGRSHYEIFPEIPERWRIIHQRCLAGATEKCEDDLFIRADNSQQWISWEIRPWYTATDEIGGIIIFSVDTSQRKQSERLLAALQEQHRAKQELEDLYNNAPCGYHSLDAEGMVVQINNTELRWLGYTCDEVVGKLKYSTFLTPEGLKIFQQNFPRLCQQGWINNLEFELCHRDGSTRWVSLTATALKDSAGNFLMSRSTMFDISDRKRAEAERQQQTQQKQLLWSITQAIRQSLELRTILTTAVTEVRQLLTVDRATVYRFNPDWSGDFIVESVVEGWVKLVEPGICKVWEDTYLQEHQGGRFKNHQTLTVTDIYTADLQPCHINLLEQFQARAYAVAPIFVGNLLWGLFALYHNTTPHTWEPWEIELLQQIADQLAIVIQQSDLYTQLQTELQERDKIDRMKAEFISIVSHELRTPLTSMQAALSLLNEKMIDPTSAEGEATIQIATDGTDRLVRLVNDILDLERLESGKVRLEKFYYDIHHLVDTAVAQMQEMANQAGIMLEVSCDSIQLKVDGDRLIQVLTNLLSNAIKFSPSESVVRLSVAQVALADAPTHLQFTVQDEGRGIPADMLERIFDRFHQVDASDSRIKGGTGLGLAICRSIAQQHGGAIWAESTLGQGSRFCFTIPLLTE